MSALPEPVPTGGLPQRRAASWGVAAAAAARVVSAQRASGTADGALGPVLVIEPDDAFRGLLTAGLSRAGFEVVACKTVRAGLLALEPAQAVPTLVVSEASLSPMDGFCLCEQLRGEMRTAHVPVLLLTHAPTPQQAGLARVVGAEELLAKPVSVEDVVTLAQLETGPRTASDVRSCAPGALSGARLVRALLAGRRSGQVGFGEGSWLNFSEGRVVGAADGARRGPSALQALLSGERWPVSVRFGPIQERQELSVGALEVAGLSSGPRSPGLEAHRRLLSLRLVPELRRLRALEAGLSETALAVVRACDGTQHLSEVLEALSLSYEAGLFAAAELVDLGALVEAQGTATQLAEARWRSPRHEDAARASKRSEGPPTAGSLSQVIELHLARQPRA